MSQNFADAPDFLNDATCEVDPYLRVAVAATFLDHEDDFTQRHGIVPLIIEAKEGRSEEIVTLLGFDSGNRIDMLDLQLTSCFIVAYVTVNTFKELHAFEAVLRIEIAFYLQTQRPPNKSIKSTISLSHTPIKSTTKKLLGIIDNGCPFAHQTIRAQDGGTRIHSIWDQNDIYDSKSAPLGSTYGGLFSRTALNQYMRNATHSGVLSESLCYQDSELPMLTHGRSHGAHTLGSAAGTIRFQSIGKNQCDVGKKLVGDEASRSDIVFIQLPQAVIQAPTRGAQTLHILNGLRYLISCAGSQTTDIYAVIDYGSYLGSHDGTSLFERAVDEIVLQVKKLGKKLHVVFAVGNGRKQKFHASMLLKNASPRSIELWMPPANETSVFVEIWFYPNSKFKLLNLFTPNRQFQVNYSDLKSVVSIGNQYAPLAVISGGTMRDGQICILVRIAPTRSQNPHQDPAPDGRWLFELSGESSQPVHCYINRGGRNFGAPRRTFQARWKIPYDSSLNTTDVLVNEEHTTIGAGCGNEVLMVGSMNWTKKDAANYSGLGPRRGGRNSTIGAKKLFPGEEAQTLRGIRGIGNYSGSSYRLIGTSTAPPQAIR